MQRLHLLLQSAARRLSPKGPAQLRFKHETVKAHDDKLYGDWKSADYVFADVQDKPNLVGRWDWHLWQFLVALVPAGLVYALAHYARYDMKQQPHLADKLKGEGINGEGGETSTSEERVALEQRLAAVESTLQALQKTLETKPTTQNIAAIASAGKSTGKEATSERSKAPT